MAPGSKPFQLLEINIISAQDLEPITRKMRTYAKAWVHPNRKLSSCVDSEGNNNPTWNDKFVFRVDESFLRQDTSAVMIEIYTTHWFRDILVGTVRVLVGNLIPPPVRSAARPSNLIGTRFVALQVRRPSGRPQGILNMGVGVLDGSLRSMPLYKDCASAVGYRDLMQEQPQRRDQNQNNDEFQPSYGKPILRRSRSERSEHIAFDDFTPNSSMVGVPLPKVKDGSILSISEFIDPFVGTKSKGKASSVINVAELIAKPKQKGKKKGKSSSVINGVELREKHRQKGKKGKASSMVNPTFYKKDNTTNDDKNKTGNEKPSPDGSNEIPTNNMVDGKSVKEVKPVQNLDNNKERPPLPTPSKPVPKHNGYDYGSAPKAPLPQSKYVKGGRFKGSSILSGSEIGPSPSEVAGMMAAERRYPLDDNQSSVLDGWSLDESVEGLKTKLERWRTELPPLYDHHGASSDSYRSSARTRRHSENGSGLFSCFGNVCGYECQCVCGKLPGAGKRSHGGRYLSSSLGSGRSFL